MTSALLTLELDHLRHILDTVPFTPGAELNTFFLDVYMLTYAELRDYNLTEEVWAQHNPVPANKLLKLGISLGNLFKSYHAEADSLRAKQAIARPKTAATPNLGDPFSDNFTQKSILALHESNLVKNLLLILKNFDVGFPLVARNTRSSRVSAADSDNSGNGSQISAHNSSPIKLNSRQLLIEKLEININLDTLFTMKIVMKLLLTILNILVPTVAVLSAHEEVNELNAIRAYSESESIFSGTSAADADVDEYLRLVRDIIARVNSGILEPFTQFLLLEIVEPKITSSFQNLVTSI